jgi:hypothetical protein
MTEIAIYVEGGGDTSQQRAELRIGFDRLLAEQKQAARNKRLNWRLVPSGSRNGAYKAFIQASANADPSTLCVLLVDSEEAVQPEVKGNDEANALLRKQHLEKRDDWKLHDIAPEQIHLMVRCMEAWIVADPEALAEYYGKDFHPKMLPVCKNLEDEPKSELYKKMAKATKDTAKGEYSGANKAKIRHASKLLARIDPKKVAVRCRRFATLIQWIDKQISNS